MKVRDAIAQEVARLEQDRTTVRAGAEAALSAIDAHIVATKALAGEFEPWLDLEADDPETRFDLILETGL